MVAKSTIPTTSGSDGPLRYGYTLPQHHPHHRPEYTSYGMPSHLILNGERLPIGTSDLNGDTDEEEEFGPSGPSQWSDAEWEAYQASLQDHNEDSDQPWDQPWDSRSAQM